MSDADLVYICPRCGFPETRKANAQPTRHVQGSPECTACLNSGQFWFNMAPSTTQQMPSSTQQQPLDLSSHAQPTLTGDITTQVPQDIFAQSASLTHHPMSPSTGFQGQTTRSQSQQGQQPPVFICERCYFFQSMEDYHGPQKHIKNSPECDWILSHFEKFFSAHQGAPHPRSTPSPSLTLQAQGIPTSLPTSLPVPGSLVTTSPMGSMTAPMMRKNESIAIDLLDEERVLPAGTDTEPSSGLSVESGRRRTRLPPASRALPLNIPGQRMSPRASPQASSGLVFSSMPQRIASGVSAPSQITRSPGPTQPPTLGQVMYEETYRMAEATPKSRRENATVLPFQAQSDLLAALQVLRVQPTNLLRNLLRAHEMAGNIENNIKTVAHYLLQPFKDAFPANQNQKNVQKAAHRMVTSIEYIINIWKLRHEIVRSRTSSPRLY